MMSMVVRRLTLGIMVVALLCVSGETVWAAPSPTDQVRETIDKVLGILKSGDDGQKERRDRITAAIQDRFDFGAMSQRALATEWKDATPDQKTRFEKLFSELLEHTYVGRIETYSNERVEYRRERVKGNKAIVDTVIVTKNIEIPMDYRLLHRDDGWFVYDVVIEEVSLVRNFRSTYGEIVKKEGFDGLFARMEAKIAELKEQGRDGAQ